MLRLGPQITFLRYLQSGIFNSLLGFGIVFSLRPFLNEFVANALAFLIVVPISFLSHRDWSFRSTQKSWHAFRRFFPVVLLGYLTNLALLFNLLPIFPGCLAQLIAISGQVALTYLLFKKLVFIEQKIELT